MKLRVLLVVMCIAISMIPIGIIGGFQGFEFATVFLIGIILLATFFVSFVMAYFISRPLEKLTKTIDKISKGDLEVNLEKSEIYEVNKLTKALDRVLTSLKLAIHKVGVKRGEIFEETVKAKAEAEERYQNILQCINGWVYETDPKGVLTSCSGNITQILGYTPEEICGRSLFDFIPAENTKKLKAAWAKTGKKHTSLSYIEHSCIDKDGQIVSVCTSLTPVFDREGNLCGYRGIQQDITRYAESQEKAEELTRRLSEMTEQTRQFLNGSKTEKIEQKVNERKISEKESEQEFDALFLFDENAHIVECTKPVYEHLGYTKNEMLALSVSDVDILETPQSIQEKIRQVKKQGSLSVKTIHRRKDGTSMLVYQQIDYLKDSNVFRCSVKEEPS